MVVSDTHVESGKIVGDVRVAPDGDLTVAGMVTGTVTVQSGGHAQISGMVGGLVVEPGGRAELHGMCTGNVTNHIGGELFIEGSVHGSLAGRSNTYVAPGAYIGR